MRARSLIRFGPAEHYYWYRKQREVVELLLRHPEIWEAGGPRRCVDIGCGGGLDLTMLAHVLATLDREGSWNLLGIDGSADGLEEARRRLLADGVTSADLRLARLERRWPLDDASVRLLFSSEVVEHLEDPAAFLSECYRILTPGGHLILTTPNQPNLFQPSFWSRSRREKNRAALFAAPPVIVQVDGEDLRVFGHISIHTVAEWRRMIAGAGFTIVAHRRGALFYGARAFMDREWFVAVRSVAEAVLDWLPMSLTRSLSDQLIVLARKPGRAVRQ